MQQSLTSYWDQAQRARGHTGWKDRAVYRYDQPIRLRAIKRILKRLYPRGMSNLDALDIGCGTGDFVDLLHRAQARVTGLDISPEVIARTRERFADRPEIKLLAAPIEEASLPGESFDVITSITVLQHVVDADHLARSLRALRNALRPDGRLIVLELAPPHNAPVANTEQPVIERPPAFWCEAFRAAELQLVEQPVLPQLGISLLRGLARAIDRVRSAGIAPAVENTTAVPNREDARPTRGMLRTIARLGLAGVRHLVLGIAWPIDYLLGLPLPSQRHRYYRIFVLAPVQDPARLGQR